MDGRSRFDRVVAITAEGQYVVVEANYTAAASYTAGQQAVYPELIRSGDQALLATVGTRTGGGVLRPGRQIRVVFQGDVWNGGPTLHGH